MRPPFSAASAAEPSGRVTHELSFQADVFAQQLQEVGSVDELDGFVGGSRSFLGRIRRMSVPDQVLLAIVGP